MCGIYSDAIDLNFKHPIYAGSGTTFLFEKAPILMTIYHGVLISIMSTEQLSLIGAHDSRERYEPPKVLDHR